MRRDAGLKIEERAARVREQQTRIAALEKESRSQAELIEEVNMYKQHCMQLSEQLSLANQAAGGAPPPPPPPREPAPPASPPGGIATSAGTPAASPSVTSPSTGVGVIDRFLQGRAEGRQRK